ncbi:glycosyltransferase [Vreelandella jeotgali]|uniref:glycosyltransferase n=1 Tax=Vreelandella jeotgali TaxID=553386 RepID=UPI00034C20B1|nr:glycosyltransferase family 2 protein [Halomonas jeotgali]
MAICVPTLNAGALWRTWLERVAPLLGDATLYVVDSSSTDETAELARRAGAQVRVIERAAFGHGKTRDEMLYLMHEDIAVFLTQDALPVDAQAMQQLVAAFDDPSVGAAFGRQLSQADASHIAAHARRFNYPAHSYTASNADIPRLGIKTAFLSNSFAAYRRQALIDAGGFPHGTILSEDMIAGARLLQYGWRLTYCAEACVYHSHNYTLGEEAKRYFDIGVLHGREAWLLARLGKPEGEGARFVRSEAKYLVQRAPWRLPEAALRTLLKYAGYRLGRAERLMPAWLKPRLSMHRGYWR